MTQETNQTTAITEATNQEEQSTQYARPLSQPFWRTDSKALVGAVIMGIAFVLVQQLTERVDAILDPSLQLLNCITWASFTGLITLIYRQPAGLITGEIEALFAIFTGTIPLAPMYIFANGFASLAYSIAARFFAMDRWRHHFIAMAVCNVVGNIFIGIGLVLILNMRILVAIGAVAITTVVGTIFATIIVKNLSEVVKKSGLI